MGVSAQGGGFEEPKWPSCAPVHVCVRVFSFGGGGGGGEEGEVWNQGMVGCRTGGRRK